MKYTKYIIAALLLQFTQLPGLHAAEETAAKPPVATFLGGAGVAVANWSSTVFGVNELLEYDLDTNLFTQLEGSLCFNRLGLAVGANINVDNNAIADTHKYMGYLGFKRLMLRSQSGTLSGTARWDGQLGTGQLANTEFKSKLTNIDLLWWFPRFVGQNMPWFIGAGYTKFEIPTELKGFIYQGENHYHAGVSVFDPGFKMKMYDIIFGFDTFTGALMFPGQKDAMSINKGWGILFSTEDRFGFGKNDMSPEALAAAAELNPGLDPVGDDKSYFLVQNDTVIGAKWTGDVGRATLSLGFGYAISFLYGNGFDKGGNTSSEVILMPENSLFRQGPILRMSARW